MDLRSYYSRPKSAGQVILGKSMTQQSAAGECDINKIIQKYRSTGIVSHVSGRRPQYGDFTAIGNFQDVQAKVLLANESFAQLSSVVRRRFNNDPSEFIAFVQDPNNRAEAEALGLIETPPEPVKKPDEPSVPVAPSAPVVPPVPPAAAK